MAPSLKTLVELVRSCGFNIPLELVPYDPEPDRRVAELQVLSPERRLDRLLERLGREGGWGMARGTDAFDPRGILAALERNYVAYVLIGGLARVIRGADELTGGVDICPSLRADNLERLARALDELEAKRTGQRGLVLEELGEGATLALRTSNGELTVVPAPAGTRRGYDDLRRAVTREHIGHGLRPSVASVPDLARMMADLGREADTERLRELRRIMEIEARLPQTLGIEPA